MIFKNDFKFGITDFGDAAVDQVWADNMHAVIGANISSKCVDDDFVSKLIKHKDKVIYVACITGLGGTLLEPNVPNYKKVFEQIDKLLDKGFAADHIVIKIDPIMPYCWFDEIESLLGITYLQVIKDILKNAEERHIERIKYSFLKMNKCVLDNLKSFNPHFYFESDWRYDPTAELALNVLNNNFVFEITDIFNPYANHIAPISNVDLNVLGLDNLYRFENQVDFFKNKLQLIPLQQSCPCKCVICNLSYYKKYFLNFNEE